MNRYRLLQVGEEIKAGDEVYSYSNIVSQWQKVCVRGERPTVHNDTLDNGIFYRRQERRTYIEVMAEEDNRPGVSVHFSKMYDTLSIEDGCECLTIPGFYASSLIDAIKEVAGI